MMWTAFSRGNFLCHARVVILALIFVLLRPTDAFQHAGSSNRRNASALQAWTLPMEASFAALKSPWYNEYNPTARTTVYSE